MIELQIPWAQQEDDRRVSGETMLQLAKDLRVFSVKWDEEHNIFCLSEECDLCFAIAATPEQLLMLADELRALAVEKLGATASG